MGFLSKLFKKKENTNNTTEMKQDSQQNIDAVMLAAKIVASANKSLDEQAAEKDARPAVTEEELLKYYVEYFAPNKDFYSSPGTEKYQAYFSAVNAARDEMLQNPDLFKMATKWEISTLKQMLDNPKPAITNMIVCGLIFRMGDYGVLKSSVLCIDFCEKIPNCIALYLVLTAQKMPENQRKQVIDAGDGADKTAFKAAMRSLQVLDSKWSFIIV